MAQNESEFPQIKDATDLECFKIDALAKKFKSSKIEAADCIEAVEDSPPRNDQQSARKLPLGSCGLLLMIELTDLSMKRRRKRRMIRGLRQ